MPPSRPKSHARRRQWGADKRIDPLPTIHANPSDTRLVLGRLAIIATVAFWMIYIVYTIVRQFVNNGSEGFRFSAEATSYVVVVTFLTFSALMYLIARQGALVRFRAHKRVPRAELDKHFADNDGSITVLVPSYAEEPDVVRSTLWSAALQEYPSLRVVLLLDDPPHPSDRATAHRLDVTRRLAGEIETALREPYARFSDALLRFEFDLHSEPHGPESARELANHYAWAADWLDDRAAAEKNVDHVDYFFINHVLRGLADELRTMGRALSAAANAGATPPADRLLELYRRLVWTFGAELSTFERKRYRSLSHEANKAMNLNAYMGLMGANYRIESAPGGDVLRASPDEQPWDVAIPDSRYILTLDADSILLRDYCLRLVYFLEQPGNERVAVTQTPYSAFRGAATRIERLAGASTDLQHLLHQGKSLYGATFWVGANAVIRKAALEDIVQTETVGGFPVRRYVQDRTVIEDTESSIDLGTHGWTLVNYPERLSYSATPPDFGSLVVQRRRWANGGLLIMPKLLRQVRDRRARGERVGWGEVLLRVNYMSSIAWSSIGLVFLLAYPYDGRLLSPVVLLAAVPYFLAMASDLRYCGYHGRDVFLIYGFNLILLPVNLAGVLKSIEQAITNRKIPFARTPKVRNRTAAPILYIVVPYLIVAFSVFTFARDFSAQNWGNAAFAAFNALLASVAIVRYIGLGASVVDIWLGMTGWLFVDRTVRRDTARPDLLAQPVVVDWRSLLYNGDPIDPTAPRPEMLLDGRERSAPRELHQ